MALLNSLIRPYIRGIFRIVGEESTSKFPMRVTFADGSVYSNYSDEREPEVEVRFITRRAERMIFWSGPLGFFDAYVGGEAEINGAPGIAKIARMGWEAGLADGRIKNPITIIGIAIKMLWNEYVHDNRSLERAKQNALFHYNLPARFFELVLGPTYGYTEGYYRSYTEELDAAQRERFAYVLKKLRIERGMKVVEVGSGWGYMSVLMAKHGARVTNYGIVPEQNRVLMEMAKREGVGSLVTNVEKDHRELQREPNTYDRYVSLGVYEHAGYKCHEDWIRSIASALKPGGIGVISTMGYMRSTMTNYQITKYIFPGGNLPGLSETLLLMEKYGLTVLDIENLWHHYQRAIRQWEENFRKHWSSIQKIDPNIFDDRFKRIWEMYWSCDQGFDEHARSLNVFHITFTKGRSKEYYPPTRDFLYREEPSPRDILQDVAEAVDMRA